MKLLIASDLHGSAKYAGVLREVFDRERPDQLVLLGDLLYHGPRNPLPDGYDPPATIALLNGMKAHTVAVRGNCDSEVDAMVLDFPMMADYAVLLADNRRIFATHGHIYGPDAPPPLSPGDILLCGHTHVGALEARSSFIYMNPGSLSLPKDGHHSYLLCEDGAFARYSLAGEVLGRWPA